MMGSSSSQGFLSRPVHMIRVILALNIILLLAWITDRSCRSNQAAVPGRNSGSMFGTLQGKGLPQAAGSILPDNANGRLHDDLVELRRGSLMVGGAPATEDATKRFWAQAAALCPDENVLTIEPNGHRQCVHGGNDLMALFMRQHGSGPGKGAQWEDCTILPSLVPPEPNALVVSVGVNVGSCVSLLASKGLRVIGLEPGLDNFAMAAHTLAVANQLSENVRLVRAGAAATSRRAELSREQGNAGNSVVVSRSRREADQFSVLPSGVGKVEPISLVRLDDIVSEHVSLLQLDCQGCEIGALFGASALLSNLGADVVKFEYTPTWLATVSEGAGRMAGRVLLDLLNAHGFTLFQDPEAASCGGLAYLDCLRHIVDKWRRIPPNRFGGLTDVLLKAEPANGQKNFVDMIAISKEMMRKLAAPGA